MFSDTKFTVAQKQEADLAEKLEKVTDLLTAAGYFRARLNI